MSRYRATRSGRVADHTARPQRVGNDVVAGDDRRWPLVGGKTPHRMRMVVLLPAPLGPRKPTISPARHLERDVVDRGQRAEPLGEMAGLDHAPRHPSRAGSVAQYAPRFQTRRADRQGCNTGCSPGAAPGAVARCVADLYAHVALHRLTFAHVGACCRCQPLRASVCRVTSTPATLTCSHPFIEQVVSAVRLTYGDNLVSLAVFGSVARQTARPDSDLDLFLVVEHLPRGRRSRLATFDPVERTLMPGMAALAATGITVELSPVLRTPEDLRTASPLLLDLTEDAVMLVDRDGMLAGALADLQRRLQRLGSRRVWIGTHWYWDLKPDYRRGEIIRV